MEKYLESYPPDQKVYREKIAAEEDRKFKLEARKHLLEMAPQKTIDLHGYTAQKALEVLTQFILECKRENLKKILIIHGKGNHSSSGPVLQKIILQYIQQCELTGEYGFAPRNIGGRGALWVILR